MFDGTTLSLYNLSGAPPTLSFRDENTTYDTIIGANIDGTFYISTESVSNALVVDIGGNVGIGTTAPSSKLSVIGTVGGYTYTTTPLAIIGTTNPEFAITDTAGTAANTATLRLGTNNTTYYTYGAYIQGVEGGGIDYWSLGFGTGNGAAATTKMYIRYDGNVGVGIIDPTTLFHIKSAVPRLMIDGTTSNALRGIEFAQGGSSLADIGFNATTGELRFASGLSGAWGGIITFYQDTVEAMRINTDGYVAIGTTTTTNLLSVRAADGVMDNSYTAVIKNEEATAGRNYGLLVWAGSNADDIALRVLSVASADLFSVTGNGYCGIHAAANSSYALYVGGAIYATGNITGNSDIRYKKDITNLSNPWLYGYKDIQVIRFRYKNEEDQSFNIGYYAQNLLEHFPECVSYTKDIDRYGVKHLNMEAVNTLAIQYVKSEVDTLRERIYLLEEEIKRLKNRK
jgi:hypothetical protein